MPWQALHAAVVGCGHVRNGMGCQDFAASEAVGPELVVAAVADGAGSQPRSAQGAELAVRTALELLRAGDWGRFSSLEEARVQGVQVVEAIRCRLREVSVAEGFEMRELACTLLAVAATPEWLFAMQVGDGFICVREEGREECSVLFEPIRGEYIGQSVFVTCEAAADNLQVCLLRPGPSFVCVSSDGLEDVAVTTRPWAPYAPFLQSLERSARALKDSASRNDSLATFLARPSFDERTHDDRSMALCLWSSALDEPCKRDASISDAPS